AALAAFLAGHGQPTNPFKILKDVPVGFKHLKIPTIDSNVVSQISSNIPGVVLILILEHVAIAKSFGRLNNYKSKKKNIYLFIYLFVFILFFPKIINNNNNNKIILIITSFDRLK